MPGGKALIVPVENIQALTRGQATKAQFGEPIELALGGHSIRELRRNDAGEYLILAGDAVPDARSVDQSLWYWDGRRETAPQRLTTELPHDIEPCTLQTGAWEGIGELPDRLDPGAQVRLIMDQGYDCMYAPPNLPGQPVTDGTRTENKDVTQELVRKSRTDTVTLSGALGFEAGIRAPDVFVDQLVGTVSAPRQVTVTNTGIKPLVLGDVSLVDEGARSAAEFRLGDGTCEGTTLAVDASCTIDVRFAPTQANATSSAQVVVEGNVEGGRATAALTGNSVAAPVEDPPVVDPPAEDPPVVDPPVVDPPVVDPPVVDPPLPGPPLLTPPVLGLPSPDGAGKRPERPARTTLPVRTAVSVTSLKGRKLQLAVSARGVPRAQLGQRLTVRVKGVERAFSVRLKQGRATISLAGRGARAVRTGRPVSVSVSLPAFSVTSGTTILRAAKATKTVRVTVRR
ncbi:hypothetical protein [Conexibacter sp. CPCC 206217]|uniref:hypothetical protein n=1 Tax=Conexibacter sp. CPCC 206217 TaxID=3064574 RepID=UPI00271C4F71|nr:hypothetical protein [Conexibacter sp. CPCC 206217]MDO8211629.1 hypothetical protein [Conexibacter sp. CPCC 206217]